MLVLKASLEMRKRKYLSNGTLLLAKLKLFIFEIFRSIFRTQSNIFHGAYCEKNYRYFLIKCFIASLRNAF